MPYSIQAVFELLLLPPLPAWQRTCAGATFSPLKKLPAYAEFSQSRLRRYRIKRGALRRYW